jgi:cell division protein FtsB
VSPEETTAISAESTASEPAVEGQKPTNEGAQAPEAATKTPKEEPLSAQYAQLARKEKALRAEAQKLKSERDAFKAEREAAKAKEAELLNQYVPKERLTKETMAVLAEAGITYDQLTQQALNAPKPEEVALHNEISELRAEIKALRDGQESSNKANQDRQKQDYEQAVNHIRREVKELVASNPDFETIKETGSAEDVVELIKRTYEDDKVLLTVEQAAKEVEEHLFEEALKITRLNKIQQKLKPQPAPGAAAPKQETKQQQQTAPKTLTNAVGTSRQLSAKERAILAFKGELKN